MQNIQKNNQKLLRYLSVMATIFLPIGCVSIPVKNPFNANQKISMTVDLGSGILGGGKVDRRDSSVLSISFSTIQGSKEKKYLEMKPELFQSPGFSKLTGFREDSSSYKMPSCSGFGR